MQVNTVCLKENYSFLKGRNPVFCQYDYCYQLDGVGTNWVESIQMEYNHYGGAGAQFHDDTFWVTGGPGRAGDPFGRKLKFPYNTYVKSSVSLFRAIPRLQLQ